MIGETVYRFDRNRRVYLPGDAGPSYEGHFEPLKIWGETPAFWLCGFEFNPWKVNKRQILTGVAGAFYTASAMEDKIWLNDHAWKIADAVKHADANQLKKIAAIIGYPT